MPDGRVAEFRSQRSGERAIMPDHHVISRGSNGEAIGAYLIERKPDMPCDHVRLALIRSRSQLACRPKPNEPLLR